MKSKPPAAANKLGGDDFDERIVNWMVEEFRKEHGVDLGKDRMAMQRLKRRRKRAKIELSGMVTTNINLPFITAVDGQPLHLDMTLTRAKFEELTADLVRGHHGPDQAGFERLAGLEPEPDRPGDPWSAGRRVSPLCRRR